MKEGQIVRVILGLLIILVALLSGCILENNAPSNNGHSQTNEKPYKGGIILVNSESNLLTFANNLSEERGWILLTLISSNPEVIRQNIINISNNYSIEYLLILGDESKIPIIDYDVLENFLFERGLVPSYEIGRRDSSGDPYSVAYNVLDSIFYGNINDDPFIELAVGRLPFNDKETIEKYFLDLDMDKEINTINAVRSASSAGPVSIITVKENFKNFKVENFITGNVSTNQINTLLTNSDLFFLGSHGGPAGFELANNSYIMSDLPDLNEHRPIFISGACYTAKEFGKEFIKRGGSVYLGYYIASQPDSNVFPVRPLSQGETIGLSVNDHLNKNIACLIYNEKIMFPTIYYLIGDPSIKITCSELDTYPKLSSQLTTQNITILIPPYEKKITDEIFSDYEAILSIDGNSSSYYLDLIELPLVVYNTLVDLGYCFVDDPELVKFNQEPLILIECNDPNSQQCQCFDLKDTNYTPGDLLKRFNIDVPYKYAISYSNPFSYYFIFKLEKRNNISDFYMEVDGQPYNLSSFFNYKIISGNEENYLVINIPLNDIFDLIYNGGFFKEKKIVFNLENSNQ